MFFGSGGLAEGFAGGSTALLGRGGGGLSPGLAGRGRLENFPVDIINIM